jgi:hypothetical protein
VAISGEKSVYLSVPLNLMFRWDAEGWAVGGALIFFGFAFSCNFRPPGWDVRKTVIEIDLIPRVWLDVDGHYFVYTKQWDLTGRCL